MRAVDEGLDTRVAGFQLSDASSSSVFLHLLKRKTELSRLATNLVTRGHDCLPK